MTTYEVILNDYVPQGISGAKKDTWLGVYLQDMCMCISSSISVFPWN